MACLTREDPSLWFALQGAQPESLPTEKANPWFSVDQGLLYRWTKVRSQLVIPSPLRQRVLYLAHDLPLAGHLGPQNTYDRITARFYWPGIKAQVQCYCTTCREYPLHQGHIPWGGTLQLMPIITVPFERVGIDIVGPLVQASTQHKFLLVMVDYATRYLEAIPLRNMRTETIARELAQVFTRVGIPKQMVTDQGSSFMSEVLQAEWKFLGLQPFRTSVYHPQTNGFVERFNRTLKRRLRKFVGETEKDWRQWVPFLSFAIREVP